MTEELFPGLKIVQELSRNKPDLQLDSALENLRRVNDAFDARENDNVIDVDDGDYGF